MLNVIDILTSEDVKRIVFFLVPYLHKWSKNVEGDMEPGYEVKIWN